MEDDWDLHAVVRSCSSSTTTTSTAVSSTASKNPSSSEQDCSLTMFKDPLEPRKSSFIEVEDLHELWKPFFNNQQILPVSSPLSVLQDLPSEPKQQEIKQQLFSFVNGSKRSTTQQQNPRSKKRKYHSKKVCHVPAESLSSDTWSWRKYGQKPIKGSPYPRGYYRCSTLKGCMARKQVERNRSDPGMFIVTYTGDHSHPMPTHRNSLAGSTRPKPSPDKPPSSPEKDLAEMEEDDDDDEEEEEEEDFFAGLESFAGEFSPENLQFPWVAAGGG